MGVAVAGMSIAGIGEAGVGVVEVGVVEVDMAALLEVDVAALLEVDVAALLEVDVAALLEVGVAGGGMGVAAQNRRTCSRHLKHRSSYIKDNRDVILVLPVEIPQLVFAT